MALLLSPRTLDSPVQNLPDIGAVNSKRLAKLGIETIRDLLLTLPFGWESYGGPTQVADLHVGQQATIVGTVRSITAKRSPKRGIRLTEGTVVDAAGGELGITWFNQPWVASQLHPGDPVAIAGTVKFSRFRSRMGCPFESVTSTSKSRTRTSTRSENVGRGGACVAC